MSLIPYCEGCRWNNGCFNTACITCYCGSKYESLKAQFQQEQVIKRNDALDAMIYATTARGNGKSRYLYEKMKQAIGEGANIYMVRKNGLTAAKSYIEEVYGMFDKNSIWAPEIKNVIFNDPATIVFWSDGTKTVVKAHNEEFDPEKGLAMAICKKVLGNKGNFNNLFKKWLPEKKIVADDVIEAFTKIMNDPEEEEIKEKTNDKFSTYKFNCSNCQYEDLDGNRQPCRSCDSLYSNFKTKMNYWTVKGLAAKEGVSEKVIRKRIADGVYPGAFKQSGAWLIPIERTAEK